RWRAAMTCVNVAIPPSVDARSAAPEFCQARAPLDRDVGGGFEVARDELGFEDRPDMGIAAARAVQPRVDGRDHVDAGGARFDPGERLVPRRRATDHDFGHVVLRPLGPSYGSNMIGESVIMQVPDRGDSVAAGPPVLGCLPLRLP